MRNELLTPREKEVLELMAKGYENKKIAEELNVSLITVKTHITHIFYKLKKRSRLEVILSMKIDKIIP